MNLDLLMNGSEEPGDTCGLLPPLGSSGRTDVVREKFFAREELTKEEQEQSRRLWEQIAVFSETDENPEAEFLDRFFDQIMPSVGKSAQDATAKNQVAKGETLHRKKTTRSPQDNPPTNASGSLFLEET